MKFEYKQSVVDLCFYRDNIKVWKRESGAGFWGMMQNEIMPPVNGDLNLFIHLIPSHDQE